MLFIKMRLIALGICNGSTSEPVLKPDLSVPSIPDDASDLPSVPPVLPIDGQVPQTDSEPELNSSK